MTVVLLFYDHYYLLCILLIFSSPVYCMKVITENLMATGDDDGCVKVKGLNGAE